ncbi:hypothetical protein ANOM_003089 [Aspergillus nomiae NRRL 13137]|uniref:Uncharacterized protein n=1 Tax=Aspergillus nomiae NRRL (strain ATCC 15546 / NRRL 13137 / CBS 260.88 / M93) TaxID=1509407 RepID=A0A0L1JAF2_ASPN3|nr:uncharacterized protein ANOM_003089 [Aspergillus nomiae NRRL 13137]KNG88680.1 hypothetical protein ANOM_003089 [Aspergillus nomiae NRRL 13137]
MKSSVSALTLLFLGTLQVSFAQPTGIVNCNGTENGPKPEKHGNDILASFPQPAGDLCNDQLKGVTVEFIPTGPGGFRIDNVPPACMTLATLFLEGPGSPSPIPLGSASLGFSNISDDGLQRLQAILDARTQQ